MQDEWNKYQELVLSELKRLNSSIESLFLEQRKMDRDLEVVKFKSSLYGMLGGGISAILALFSGKSLH